MTTVSVWLKDLCEVITKGTTPTSLGFAFADAGIGFLRVQNIAGGSVNYEQDTLFIDEQVHQSLKRSQILPGDVLVSIAGTIGRTGIVPSYAPPLNCNQAVAILRPTGKVCRPYLRHWLESADAQSQMRGATVTGTIQNLSLSQVGRLQIPLPPLFEQRRVAAILDQAGAIRAKRRQSLAQLNILRKSIFIEMFGDPIPTRSPWAISQLGTACEKISDGTHHSPPIQPDGVPYVTAKHLKEYGLDFHASPWFVTEDDHRQIYARCDPKPGDVLYIKDGATTGIAAINNYSFEFSMLSSLALLRPDRQILNSSYLCHWLNSPSVKTELLGAMAGAAIRRLTLAKIKAISIPVPPLKLQAEFERRMSVTAEIREQQTKSLARLDALFASLQHRAFRGEL